MRVIHSTLQTSQRENAFLPVRPAKQHEEESKKISDPTGLRAAHLDRFLDLPSTPSSTASIADMPPSRLQNAWDYPRTVIATLTLAPGMLRL